ncbi:MAG: hypothetical protein MUD01_19290 [Chloroflexaceae bacterium]|jgi:formate hydrogenlyase subunit 3/multisubunit Na+/H+ antiporter MnhD subunit|nr:hypothetical protein [Chloroflexaceae bacterium]
MLYIALTILLLTAALCLGLSRRVETRTLGFAAAAAAALAGLVLLGGPLGLAPFAGGSFSWVASPLLVASFDSRLSPFALGLAVLLLGGASLSIASLALALTAGLRGFGAFFSWVLLLLVAALAGLGASPLLTPFAWALMALFIYTSVRASGALNQSTELPQGLVWGLLASLLLLGGAIIAAPTTNPAAFPPPLAMGCMLVACLMFTGAAPFHSSLTEATTGPSGLSGLIYGLALPVLAMSLLFRMVGSLPPLPPDWSTTLLLVGLLSVLGCAAGAYRERRLSRLLAWQAGGQVGLVLCALSLPLAQASLVVPALLLNLGLSTLAGSLAVAVLERETGSDDGTAVQGPGRLGMPGLAWALGAVSALGLPPLWGFWGRRWLLEGLFVQAPWAVPLLLGASVLAGLAYLWPLARFWQLSPPATQNRDTLTPAAQVQGMLAFLPALLLLLGGVWPQGPWSAWLAALPGVPTALPVDTATQVAVAIVAGVALLVGLLLVRLPWVRPIPADSDMESVVLAPDGLTSGLGWLAGLGQPVRLFQSVWNGLFALSNGLRLVMSLFEQRFYLVGVLLVVISLMLLVAQ